MQSNIRERIEKTREQLKTWSNETLEEFQTRQKALNERREELVRQSGDAFDAGRGAVRGAEATVLETARDLIGRARNTFGERADFLKRGEDALSEALVALRAGHRATLPIEGYDALSVRKASALLDGLDRDDLRTLRAYEESNKNRKTLLKQFDKRIELATQFEGNEEVTENLATDDPTDA